MSRSTIDARSPRPLRGDEAALYEAHHRDLPRLIARDMRSARPVVIEDACAHAWTEFVRHQPERSCVIGWLRVVARREAIRQVQRDRLTGSLDAVIDAAHPEAPRSRMADGQARAEVLEAFGHVAALPECKRRAFTRQVAGFSYQEIAAQLGWTQRTVERNLLRARAQVRRDAA